MIGAIVVKAGDAPERVFTALFTIGRAGQLRLSDQHASLVHAVVAPDGDDWFIHDQGSANGTLVNGLKIWGAHPLSRGDTATIGRTTVIFVPTP